MGYTARLSKELEENGRETSSSYAGKPPSSWLGFHKDALQSADREKCQQSYPAVDPASYTTNLPAK